MKVKTFLVQSIAASLALASATGFAAVTQQQVVENYVNIAHAVFADSLTTAKNLEKSIDTFLASPSDAKLQDVKKAWLAARVPYQQTEVFRFGNAVVDDWEGQLNAWPLDEGLIDYVATDYQYELGNEGANANIIGNKSITIGATTIDASSITPELIADLNEVGGSEANVASGYHAIEFLLWGQDLNGTNSGAGARPYTDYVQGPECTNGHCDRRAQYLKASVQLLVQDLEWMEKQWSAEEQGNYRQELLADSATNGIRKMLFGMGSLSLGELAGERMKVALEANSTEDEHDCFTDNTHNSHFYNNQGISNVYFGSFKRLDGSTLTGPSLADLVKQKDPSVAEVNQQKFDESMAETAKLVVSAEQNGVYFDQLIAADNTQGHALINGAILALVEQTRAIEHSAKVLGIENLNPDTADHEF